MIQAGVDEAGRGPIAGPLVVAAVVLDPLRPIAGIRDSKALGASARETLAQRIRSDALAWSLIEIDVATIDRLNIFQATMLGMRRALETLSHGFDEALIDGNKLPPDLPCRARAIVKGDAKEASIGAASILAKTHRDALMRDYDRQYPAYGFIQHMGYPTPEHLARLRECGPCAIHRHSYAPVRLAAQSSLFGA